MVNPFVTEFLMTMTAKFKRALMQIS